MGSLGLFILGVIPETESIWKSSYESLLQKSIELKMANLVKTRDAKPKGS